MYVDGKRHTSAVSCLVSGGAGRGGAYQGSPGVKCLADQRLVTSGTAPRRSTCWTLCTASSSRWIMELTSQGLTPVLVCSLYVCGGRSSTSLQVLQNCKLDMYIKQGTHRPTSPQLGGMHALREKTALSIHTPQADNTTEQLGH